MVCAWLVLDVLTIFCIADMSCMSNMKCGCSVPLLLVAYEPYVNCKSWMSPTSPVKRGRPVCRTRENYVDGCRKLLEDREGDGNVGNLPR